MTKIITFLAIVAAIYAATHPNWSKDTHTVYYEFCPDLETLSVTKSYKAECPVETVFLSAEYRVIPELQMVISEGMIKLEDCTVFSEEKWTCSTALVNNGSYMKSFSEHKPYENIGIPRWLYHLKVWSKLKL